MPRVEITGFIGQRIDGYEVVKHLGSGAVGHMFQCTNEALSSNRAIKFIPVDSLRAGWDNEIKKVNKLGSHDKIVRYFSNGKTTISQKEYAYIFWEYIENDSLRKLIDERKITIPILVDAIRAILEVLHACKVADIVHADLHAGNILVQKENPLNIDPTVRKIWVTDFGYVIQNDGREYLDDYQGLNRLIKDALRAISFNDLDGDGKRIYRFLNETFSRQLLETNPLEEVATRNPALILGKLNMALNYSPVSTQAEHHGGIGDYLAAEHLGENFDEWKAIFVPKFIAINELLERNICVLTGLRGCGKTMLFKRLSSYFNIMIGENTQIPGSDSFLGFYLNARDVAEAFPWLPKHIENKARNQLIHNFHLNWCLEILAWIREKVKRKPQNVSFLNGFFHKYYPDYFTSSASQSIHYLYDFVRNEIDKSRLGSSYREDNWPLTSYSFLDELVSIIKYNMEIPKEKPFYFFLDDYSLPMVKESTQRILNPIIFRRSADVIFKVATESVESFISTGLNGKVLEENDDYRLIDCGTLALIKSNEKDNQDILFSVLQPRIERHPLLKERNLDLQKMLGETLFTDEDRARIIRGDAKYPPTRSGNTKYLYQGWDVFASMWSSSIREMIDLFANMVASEKEESLLEKSDELISSEVQDKVYKDSGGQFISLLGAATDPSAVSLDTDHEHTYAKHLVKIVKAFHEIASYSLKYLTSKNQNNMTIKKARRIEITDLDTDLPDDIRPYYQGLIRYGVFIRDNRGKSVRGKIVPRLYLRSRLIPSFRLAFSKRDSITMNSAEFVHFLSKPDEFINYYKSKYPSEEIKGQISIWEDNKT